MSKYLLEVGVEELPYKFIPMAISQLKNGFETFLNDNNVKYEKVNVMANPRTSSSNRRRTRFFSA